jgi:hypothetical protein
MAKSKETQGRTSTVARKRYSAKLRRPKGLLFRGAMLAQKERARTEDLRELDSILIRVAGYWTAKALGEPGASAIQPFPWL